MTLLLLAACNDTMLGSADKPPTIEIVTPLDDATFDPTQPVSFCAQIDDNDSFDELEILVQSSLDGTLWQTGDSAPITCDGGNFGLSLVVTGASQTIGISAVDSAGQASEAQVRIVPAVNTVPWCEIDTPEDNSTYIGEAAIPFLARASDGETDAGDLQALLKSDLDGDLWEGTPDSSGDVTTPDLTLSGGTHLLTLTVTDERGAIDICGVHVTVDPCVDLDLDGVSTCDGDCDDNDASALPGGIEVADGADNDCNGITDDQTTLYDDDGDGWTELDGDCDDTDADVNPDEIERWYDGTDQDCDGADDDQDGDGFVLADDCDDTDAAVNPYATEVWYDGVDDDCDGNDDDRDEDGYAYPEDCDDLVASVNPGAAETWYDGTDQDCDGVDDDRDSDGYGIADDCDDTDATVNPGAAEVWYDGTDQDCDGNDVDQDGDGVAYTSDCDDTDASINGGEVEIWYDGIDQDCDGNDDDQDEDGVSYLTDCDDTDPARYPGAVEIWYDGIDEDCLGGDDDDQDGDGSRNGIDCDDTDASINGGAAEIWYDGVDQDCDGNDDDQDEDGYGYTVDCDDTDADVNPGALEVWYDGVDDDCDGNDDDQDEDGYVLADDCDDTDADVNPAGTESRNGYDDDCDGACDEGVLTAGELVITEIMKNPATPVDDTYGEWFEVYNASDTLITMCGWTIADNDGESIQMTSDVEVWPGEYALFIRNASTSLNGGLTADYVYGINGTFQLGNSGDELVLSNDGTEIDRVDYTTSFPNLAGYSLTLDADALDATSNNTASNWCSASTLYTSGNYGTPGAANDACP